MSDTTQPFDVSNYIAQSLEGMRAATSAHCATWHLDEAEQWSVDMDSGLIVFQERNRTTVTLSVDRPWSPQAQRGGGSGERRHR